MRILCFISILTQTIQCFSLMQRDIWPAPCIMNDPVMNIQPPSCPISLKMYVLVATWNKTCIYGLAAMQQKSAAAGGGGAASRLQLSFHYIPEPKSVRFWPISVCRDGPQTTHSWRSRMAVTNPLQSFNTGRSRQNWVLPDGHFSLATLSIEILNLPIKG